MISCPHQESLLKEAHTSFHQLVLQGGHAGVPNPDGNIFFCVSGHAFITSLWWDSVLPDVQSTKETHYCHMFLGSWLFGYNSHSITTSGDSKKHIYLLVKWGLCVLTFFPLNNNGSLQMCRFFFYFKIPSTLTCFLKIVQPHMTENFVLTVLC